MDNWESKSRSAFNKAIDELDKTDPNDLLRLGMIFIKIHNAARVAMFGYLRRTFPEKYNEKEIPDFPVLVDEVSVLVNFENDVSRSLKAYNKKRNLGAHEIDGDDIDFNENAAIVLRDVQGLANLVNDVLNKLMADHAEVLSMSWKCPKCKSENLVASRYCSVCKFDYVAYEEELRKTEKRLYQEKINQDRKSRGLELCPSCKNFENSITARYCGSCGTDIMVYKVVPAAQKLAKASLIISLSPILLACFFCIIQVSTYIFYPIVMVLGFISFAVGFWSIFKLLRLRISLSYVSQAFFGMFIGLAEIILPGVLIAYILSIRFSS